jgi:hypothetical protein
MKSFVSQTGQNVIPLKRLVIMIYDFISAIRRSAAAT